MAYRSRRTSGRARTGYRTARRTRRTTRRSGSYRAGTRRGAARGTVRLVIETQPTAPAMRTADGQFLVPAANDNKRRVF